MSKRSGKPKKFRAEKDTSDQLSEQYPIGLDFDGSLVFSGELNLNKYPVTKGPWVFVLFNDASFGLHPAEMFS